MAKLPWFKFNPSWWMSDTELSKCTPATRGVWIDLLCAMHQSGRSGELRGTTDQIARLARCSTAELTQALTELQTTGTADVTFRNNDVIVSNRLMKREAKERKDGANRQARFRELGGGDPDRWTYIRSRILLLDEKKCAYCGRKATSVDHIIPRTKGGGEEDYNLVACCKICNSTKNNRLPSEAGMTFHVSFTRLNMNQLFGSNGKSNPEVTGRSKKIEDRSKNVVVNNEPFFEFFRRVTGPHITDDELMLEIQKFKNKYPNIHPNHAGALINTWVANIGKVNPIPVTQTKPRIVV